MTHSDFRLARHSQRRRRVVSLHSDAGASRTLDFADRDRVETEPSVAATERQPVSLPLAPPPIFSDAAPVDTRFLNATRALTWVFAGDALLAGDHGDDQVCSLVRLFADQIRSWPQRSGDRMVDVLQRGATITNLMAAWESRVIAHAPDVVVLSCGHHDSAAGMRGFQSFEDSLESLLLYCRHSGIAVIVNTPPCLPERDERRLADRLIYLEALRAATKTHDAVLVDHWERWEWIAVEVGGTEAWYDASGQYPGEQGHRQMTRLFETTMNQVQTCFESAAARKALHADA